MQIYLKKQTTLFSVVMLSLVFMQGCGVTRSEHQVHSPQLSYDLDVLSKVDNIIPMAILGSGPAGLGAAIYGARENIKTVVFEGDKPGGLLMYTTGVANWPGHKLIMGPQIIKDLNEQARSANAELLDDTVDWVDFSTWPFVLHTVNDRTLNALSVVITTGATSRTLGVPGETEFWGQGVTACAVCDAHFFKGEDVVVVGGGDSAVEQALQLANHAKSITILVRKGEMRAAASMQKRLAQHSKIKILYNVKVNRIIGGLSEQEAAIGTQGSHAGHVTAVELVDTNTNATFEFKTSGVFLAIGHVPNSSLFKKFLAIDQEGYIQAVGRTQQSSLPGVFVAGEVEDHRYRQAGVSYGDGSKAALDALGFLRSIGFNQDIEKKLKDEDRIFELTVKKSPEIPALETVEAVDAALKSPQPVVIDFYTQECVACKQSMPAVNSIAEKMSGNVSFYKVDAGSSAMSPFIKKCAIEGVPSLILFKDAQAIARYNPQENVTRKDLVAFIQENMPDIQI